MNTNWFENTTFWLRITAAACALVGLAALVSHVFGVLPMLYFLPFFGVPSLVLLFTIAAIAKRLEAETFLQCLAVGLLGGFIATLAYDLSRWIFTMSGLFDYNGFRAIYIFGSWITGMDVTTPQAAAAGWFYHFWNGISFGIFYTLAFGRRHWTIGAAYGLFMEACMLGLFPMFISVTDRWDFVGLSLLGHLVYGIVLGLIAQRYARNWSDVLK